MKRKLEKNDLPIILSNTEIPDLFFTEYFTQASGDYIKVYLYLKVKYSLTETGKVVKRINPKSLTRECRKIKSYKNLLIKGDMTYPDIEQSVRSWMGSFVSIMSKKQIKKVKNIYKELFRKELP